MAGWFLIESLGLDKPLPQQYLIWLGNILQGDFGRSWSLNRPVIDEVLERFNATLILAGTAFVLCSLLGVAAGVVSAANQYGWADRAITFVVLLGISIPSFFLGMMMILAFAVNLRLLPVSGMWPIYGDRDLLAIRDVGAREHAPLELGGEAHTGSPLELTVTGPVGSPALAPPARPGPAATGWRVRGRQQTI